MDGTWDVVSGKTNSSTKMFVFLFPVGLFSLKPYLVRVPPLGVLMSLLSPSSSDLTSSEDWLSFISSWSWLSIFRCPAKLEASPFFVKNKGKTDHNTHSAILSRASFRRSYKTTCDILESVWGRTSECFQCLVEFRGGRGTSEPQP